MLKPQPMNESDLETERRRLLASVVDYFSAMPAVCGIFLGGSIPAGRADAWSDIDMRVVIDDDQHATFVENRLAMPAEWGELVFNEWLDGTSHCVSHFKPFGKIDVFYISAKDFRPSPWYALPVSILYERDTLLTDVFQQSQNLDFTADRDEISRSISKGLATGHEVYRRIQKNQLFYCQSLLNELRYHMIKADDWINDRPPQTEAYSRLELRGSPDMLELFGASYTGTDEAAIRTSLKGLLDFYRDQIKALHTRFSPERSLDNDMCAIGIVLDNLD